MQSKSSHFPLFSFHHQLNRKHTTTPHHNNRNQHCTRANNRATTTSLTTYSLRNKILMMRSVSTTGGLKRSTFTICALVSTLMTQSTTSGFQHPLIPAMTRPFTATAPLGMVQNRGLEVRREGATPTGEQPSMSPFVFVSSIFRLYFSFPWQIRYWLLPSKKTQKY